MKCSIEHKANPQRKKKRIGFDRAFFLSPFCPTLMSEGNLKVLGSVFPCQFFPCFYTLRTPKAYLKEHDFIMTPI